VSEEATLIQDQPAIRKVDADFCNNIGHKRSTGQSRFNGGFDWQNELEQRPALAVGQRGKPTAMMLNYHLGPRLSCFLKRGLMHGLVVRLHGCQNHRYHWYLRQHWRHTSVIRQR
jgi:hypothetical protein